MTDFETIQKIGKRGSELYKRINGTDVKPQFIASEVWIVHNYICPLRLDELAEADEANFAHDVGGIHRHLDLGNKKLNDCFRPRFAK
jgi:hypothetical protein